MRKVILVRDYHNSENIEIELDGETIIDCKEYETNIWMQVLLEHLDVEYFEEERELEDSFE